MTSLPRPTCLLASCLLAMAAMIPAAGAQNAADRMPGMEHAMPNSGPDSPASQGYKAANDKMMGDMNLPLTGDADRDFVAGMIPHHQGAIDMAQIELKYGKDPQLRKLARDIVAAQKKEIALMTRWQQRHGVATAR